VQGAHAVAQYLLNNPKTMWNNGTMVFLSVKNENDLALLVDKMMDSGKRVSLFFEPDLGYQLTSFACVDTGEIFKDLPLM
jgi:hypothetical protein